MATIEERQTTDGKTHFRAKVRLRGYPAQSRTFERKTDAKRCPGTVLHNCITYMLEIFCGVGIIIWILELCTYAEPSLDIGMMSEGVKIVVREICSEV